MTRRMTTEDKLAVEMALGRIFGILSRPAQPGDREEYERCRRVVLEVAGEEKLEYVPCWVRDRMKGAAGD